LARWLATHDVSGWVGAAVVILFCFLAWLNINAVSGRQTSGQTWHSMSRGESLYGSENSTRDRAITVVTSLILFSVAPFVGLLFGLSRFFSRYLIVQEQKSVYARYLDAMDAKLEAEHLERALRDGVPPRTTEGLYNPLPKRFTGEHRANVARVVAGGFATTAAQARSTTAQPGVGPQPSAPGLTARVANAVGAVPAMPNRPVHAGVLSARQIADGVLGGDASTQLRTAPATPADPTVLPVSSNRDAPMMQRLSKLSVARNLARELIMRIVSLLTTVSFILHRQFRPDLQAEAAQFVKDFEERGFLVADAALEFESELELARKTNQGIENSLPDEAQIERRKSIERDVEQMEAEMKDRREKLINAPQ